MSKADPLKVAYEELMEVFIFLQDKEESDPEFTKYYDIVGNVLDQFTGFCSKSFILDAKYPDSLNVEPDLEWRKSIGIQE